jgi:hypothetical protein
MQFEVAHPGPGSGVVPGAGFLPDGVHVLKLTASDVAGNELVNSSAWRWTYDTTPPTSMREYKVCLKRGSQTHVAPATCATPTSLRCAVPADVAVGHPLFLPFLAAFTAFVLYKQHTAARLEAAADDDAATAAAAAGAKPRRGGGGE